MKLSIKEYMISKNVSRRTIYNRIEKGQLITIKENNRIYIISENFKTNNQLTTSISEIKKITENTNKISNLQDKLEEFDYSFLRERLASIEKSIIIQLNKISSLSDQSSNSTKSIEILLKDIDKKLDNLNKIQSIKEQVGAIEEYQINISKNIDNLVNKLDNFIERQDKKKIGIFKK